MRTPIWHSIETEEVLKELATDVHHGLTKDEAKKRLEKYGYNELKKGKGISPFTIFINQFKNILILILLAAMGLSALIGEVLDAAMIGAIVFFCTILGFIQEYRAERALEALKKMLSPTITVLREGEEQEIPTRELVPGDILLLEAGDKVPADARLVESYSLKCDEAPLTGESIPIEKDTKLLPEEVQVSDRKNMVFTGTAVTYGRGKAVVTSTGMTTEFGKIAEEVTAVKTEQTPLEKRIAEIGKLLGIISVGACFLVVAISLVREFFLGGNIDLEFILTMVMFAIALAVMAVPEALPAVVTGTLAIGMHQMARKNALVRKMPAVETLGCTTVICSDKTGTLTKGEMTVRKIFTGGILIEVTGAGYAPEGEFKGLDLINATNNQPFQLLLQGGLLCNDAHIYQKDGKWFIKGDPTEAALVVAAVKAGIHKDETRLENPRIKEIPFSSERKRMTTIHQMQNGKRMAFMKGAPEKVLERCSRIQDGDEVKALTTKERAQILKINEEMAQGALRVLGIAYKEVPEGTVFEENTIESDLVFLGLFGMMDPPREEAIKATNVCKQVGIKPIMITGDHKLTAVAIAKEIGIYKEGDMVLTGEELEKVSDEEFEKIVDKVTVYARVSPIDKLKIVKAWKKKGEVVAMTGDGVNDAPALKHADTGIAMGITGTEVTKEAADMILSDDNFATIVSAIERGRWIYDNIKKYLTFLLQCNIVGVIAIGGIVLLTRPEFLPLLPAAILYINLVTNGPPALALGVAPPDHDIMQRPPRDPKESVFGWDVKSFILSMVLIKCPFLFFLFFHGLGDIAYARTEIFFTFIIIELITALNFRSLIHSIFKAPPHKWLLIAVISQFLLTAILVQIPTIREGLGVMKPLFFHLVLTLGFGIVVFAIIEVTKVILRQRLPTGRRIAV